MQSQLRFSLKLISILFVVLIAICALGIIGITSYRVTTSYRHIAIRRALGATRWQVCRYFLCEEIVMFLAAFAYAIILAPALARLLGKVMNTEFLLPFYTIATSGGIVLTVVLLAATYPILQASRIAPTSLTGKLAAKK